ncbi:MAG: N-acetylglucosamine-6-phosphate deacetylase, partial [Gammaproteobacteria bacterium]|nr:N-acetylglucosamine-6-phosphate deacetylase [Gammaproteobacteria bacterium]
MPYALVNGRLLTEAGFVQGRAALIDGDRFTAVVDESDPRCARSTPVDLGGRMLLPGFIDTQVNGGGGVQFNDDPSVEAIRVIGRAHRRFGTTGFLPTLISDEPAVMARAIAAVGAAIEAGVPGLLGIHIEGPFLNEARKGVHDPAKFRDLDDAAVRLLTSLQAGKTVVTLAPEVTTPEVIARLSAAGVLVSAGHSDASHAVIRSALRSGLRGFTHLFNTMSQMTGREPGVVGAALDDASGWCGIIVDGRHVDPVMLRIALRCRPHDRFMLVTDAMACVGTA